MTARTLAWLIGVVFFVTAAVGEARSNEIVVSLSVASDLLPTRVCIHAAKVGPRFASKVDSVEALKPDEPALMAHFAPTCAASDNENDCNRCEGAREVATGGVVCLSRPEGGTDAAVVRELQLQLDNAALVSLSMQGADVLLGVEHADSSPARVRNLGGAYYDGLAQAVTANGPLELKLRNRCVKKRIVYSADPTGAGQPLTSLRIDAGNGRTKHSTDAAELAELDEKGMATLLVPELDASTTVTLERSGTVYTGAFSYPSVGPVELLATKFRLTWHKSCFFVERGSTHGASENKECPQATLVQHGTECSVKPASAASQCEYECQPRHAIRFPTSVRFELIPPMRARGATHSPKIQSGDRLVWEDIVRFPGDELSSFSASEDRRVYLSWPDESWDVPGREVEAIEIIAPDGNVHRVGRDADTLSVAGLQCPATFSYRYLGRLPHRTGTLSAQGDRLDIPSSDDTRRPVVFVLQAHAGGLYHGATDPNVSWSPAADVEIMALISGAEVSVSGTYTENPSVLTFGEERERWSSSPQVKTLFYFGYRFRASKLLYIAPALGGGLATRALASDWSRSEPNLVGALRARMGYDLSSSVAIEVPVTLGFSENYISNHQDAGGPHSAELRDTWSLSFALGLQWADVF